MQSPRNRPSTANPSTPPSGFNTKRVRKATSSASLRTATVGLRTPPEKSYFDVYPRTRPNVSRTITPRPLTADCDSPPTPQASSSKTNGNQAYREQNMHKFTTHIAFPSAPCDVDDQESLYSNPFPRGRTRTGPSSVSTTTYDSFSRVPTLRFSESSTPPDTPLDFKSELEQFPAVVTVEAMDALVDGMNGGDTFSHRMSAAQRNRFGIHGHHPLYTPPLPTPPPGVILGGRKPRKKRSDSDSSSSGEGAAMSTLMAGVRSRRRRPQRPSIDRMTSTETMTASIQQHTPPPSITASRIADRPRTIAPSISEIIRNHTPPSTCGSRPSSRLSNGRSSSHFSSNHAHTPIIVHEEPDSQADDELVSRSSIDSIAAEVQNTLRNQASLTLSAPHPSRNVPTLGNRASIISDGGVSLTYPHSEPGATSSIYSSSYTSSQPAYSPIFMDIAKPTPSDTIATYLRSSRLTTLLKLTRSPHASQDNPLTVSLSDLGDRNGYPVVVFLGLGCVRHIMGLYDDMAELLGLRLITIDRWGLGRTEPRSKSAKGVIQWAAVVEEVLDRLRIDKCSIMAHSAGAPYALSFANKLPSRIRGDLCLLAPWVGGSDVAGTYKWLKYVPNGILKTAQAAEWKLQTWMIGRPPTLTYQGIGYNAQAVQPNPMRRATEPTVNNVYPSEADASKPRPSVGSSTFSEYDDLQDFNGKFGSRSTLEGEGSQPTSHDRAGSESKLPMTRKKSLKFMGKLKSGSPSTSSATPEGSSGGGKRLKGLRSMSSLKTRSLKSRKDSKHSDISSSHLPPSAFHFDADLGLGSAPYHFDGSDERLSTRTEGRRSLSLTVSSPTPSMPSSPATSTATPTAQSGDYQVLLGNALIAASHAESAKGTHNDLLQILNHDNHPWGFSYSSYPHQVRLWYGDRDEKIAETAVRWMEKTMGEDQCLVTVVKGADHSLMYKSSVVVEVLEHISGYWR